MSQFDKIKKEGWKNNNSPFMLPDWDREKGWQPVQVECDDCGGVLLIGFGPDGDIHVALNEHPRGDELGHMQAGFRCRTWPGGGRNHRVHEALALLMLAIQEDNAENNPNHGGGAMSDIVEDLKDAGFVVVDGAKQTINMIKSVSGDDTQPLCSGYRVFPDGTKCNGCADCKEANDDN